MEAEGGAFSDVDHRRSQGEWATFSSLNDSTIRKQNLLLEE